MKGLKFKTTKPVGRYRSFYLPTHDIKINNAIVGSIDPEKTTQGSCKNHKRKHK